MNLQLFYPDLYLGEAYTDGSLIIENGTLTEFLEIAFKCINIDDWEKYVLQDERYMRPAEVAVLCGDSSKAREVLGWEPETSFEQMIINMITNDIELLT